MVQGLEPKPFHTECVHMQADVGPSRKKKNCRPGWIYDETNPVLSDFRQKMSERFPMVLEGTWAPNRKVCKVFG